ncbi:hypothetical protein JCGZ_24188 [Jatropha curcas]|uniref:Uncharacterized protein n=1 Tax=Jatropha curcas TaxID=180498 RepID=A0A067JYV1_JATCU|nr:hypothetical protein JCGZ_24188 [Jatropha curcas]
MSLDWRPSSGHFAFGECWASSSAQRPVLPPSLPSAPSSSTPVSGPVQSSLAAQSPTVQGYTWDAGPQEATNFYWEEFQKHFIWDEAITAMLKVAWEKLCADRYADFTYRMRRSGKKQQCVSQEIWESWQKAWEDPAFKRKRKIFAQNRRSETSGDGAGPCRHIGGSISAIETARLLRKRKVYGIGSQASQFYCGSAAHASTASAEPQPKRTDEHYTDLRAQLADQQKQIAELRAHVMRLAYDTLVTPPGATSHPAGTPPGNPTSNPADEQQRRFDFGPF